MIKRLISERVAANGMLVLFSLVIVFHLLVLVGIIPSDIVWGGRLQNKQEMVVFELLSIVLNVLMLTVVTIKINLLKVTVNKTIIKGIFWMMFVLFAVNTIGNLFAMSSWETTIFTPITFLLALFSLRLAVQ